MIERINALSISCVCKTELCHSYLFCVEFYVISSDVENGELLAAEPLTTLMEAAGQLGVGVFGSGPLQEAALLQRPAMQVNPLLQVLDVTV